MRPEPLSAARLRGGGRAGRGPPRGLPEGLRGHAGRGDGGGGGLVGRSPGQGQGRGDAPAAAGPAVAGAAAKDALSSASVRARAKAPGGDGRAGALHRPDSCRSAEEEVVVVVVEAKMVEVAEEDAARFRRLPDHAGAFSARAGAPRRERLPLGGSRGPGTPRANGHARGSPGPRLRAPPPAARGVPQGCGRPLREALLAPSTRGGTGPGAGLTRGLRPTGTSGRADRLGPRGGRRPRGIPGRRASRGLRPGQQGAAPRHGRKGPSVSLGRPCQGGRAWRSRQSQPGPPESRRTGAGSATGCRRPSHPPPDGLQERPVGGPGGPGGPGDPGGYLPGTPRQPAPALLACRPGSLRATAKRPGGPEAALEVVRHLAGEARLARPPGPAGSALPADAFGGRLGPQPQARRGRRRERSPRRSRGSPEGAPSRPAGLAAAPVGSGGAGGG
jgi:hypothetical protein